MQPPYPPYPPYRPYPAQNQQTYPPRQRSYLLFFVSIIALFLVVVIGVGEYLYFSAKTSPETSPVPVTIHLPTPTPTPTPDDNFKSFLTSFSQVLTSNDGTTITSDIDQNNFSTNVQCFYYWGNYSSNCRTWADLDKGLGAGQITLTIHTPILYTCIAANNAYATHAVMGTYSIQNPSGTITNQRNGIAADNGASGLATFVFAQEEQGGPWLWVNLTINRAQCPPS